MYELYMSDVAKKQISKLDKDMQVRIRDVLERVRIRPHAFAKKLSGSDYFRFRVGDYRLIVDIQDDKLIILVIEIGHRKNIYD